MGRESAGRVNWPVVLGVEAVGLALIGLALALEHWLGWVGVSESILVDVGSATLLVGVLYFVEKRFLVRVTEAVQEAAISGARAETTDIRTRLSELDARMEAAVTERNRDRGATVEAVTEATFDSLARALAQATALGTIHRGGTITVQGSKTPGELGVTFSWGLAQPNGRFGTEGGPELAIEADLFRPGQLPRVSLSYIVVQRRPGASFEQVGLALIDAISRAGAWRSSDTLDWPATVKRLQAALDWANRSRLRTGDPDELRGQLIEVVADGWAVTTAGVEAPTLGVFLPTDSFPEAPHWRFHKQPEVEWTPPSVPDGVEPNLWNLVIARARARYPLHTGPYKTFPDWMPLSNVPEDL